ncbi:tRNA-dihydrouridine(16/17) synthase [NAD(P)(+)]-like [Aplysia californica]|uniref:tRNA-dihydrouridine(16/17) synthase [NAD(P)(+)] n=1 Tax=Aplysia californica TaxID=6500 RepID=A0ABM0K4S6_APLCA|nr:tRNA-dihydrouridine(16/17) synthase [NAD(P)(+)]-like [Aplysia californica]
MEVNKESDEEHVEENSGFQFWRKTLNSPKYIVAPMVDQSELAWRMLSRRYGADLCYTPMFHAAVFVKDPNYRRDSLQSCAEDRPLIIQFCANDPEILLQAAKMAEGHCDAVDLNLGCPQVIAKRGHYGAFLQDEWDLVSKMVQTCHENLNVPITCKIRVFPSTEKTVEYARMLEKAGCQLLTVHGRTREQKGKQTGCADWLKIKAVREAVSIPVFANGNIQYLADVHRCLKETGVQGIMSAEGNLHNPMLFTGGSPCVWEMVNEYLDLVEKYPCPLSYMRGHVFKLCHHALAVHRNVRDLLASAKTYEELREAATMLKDLSAADIEKAKHNPDLFTTHKQLDHPYWICQPYVRLSDSDLEQPEHRAIRQMLNMKRAQDMEKMREEHSGLSIKKLKKRLKHPHKNFDTNRLQFESCTHCRNPKGTRCPFNLCKTCCRLKVNAENVDCSGHNFRRRHGKVKEACDSLS